MKKLMLFAVVIAVALSFGLFQGCDWEDSGSSSYNTSRGAGVTVNFSGYYRPRSGSYLVMSNITHFVMNQIGNYLEVYDNNNSMYTGNVGAPGVQGATDATTGAYDPGAEMLQAQISFSGKNAATGADVQFVGLVRAVAVDDVDGIETVTSTTVDTTDNFGLDITDTSTPGTTVTIGNSSNVAVNVQTDVTRTYTITDANTQYVLEGNWVEAGMVYGVSAIAPSSQGSFTTASSSTTATTTTP